MLIYDWRVPELQPLRIRAEQMEAFAISAMLDFEEHAVNDLREVFAEECAELSEPDLRALVQRCLRKALGYGVEREDDVMAYLYLAMENGEGFEGRPEFAACREAFEDGTLNGSTKIEVVYSLLEGPEGH